MRKETLWSILIVATVLVTGVVAIQQDVWLSPSGPVIEPSTVDSLNKEIAPKPSSELQQKVTDKEATKPSQAISSPNNSQADKTNESVKGNEAGKVSSINSDSTSAAIAPPISNAGQPSPVMKEKSQRTRIIVREPVIVDGVDVMAELKGKVLSEDEAIQLTNDD